MKKFTRKTTSNVGGYLSNTLRFVALSLIAMLWAQSAAFAQCSPPPVPVLFDLSEAQDCYNADNSYEVEFSTQYFENVDKFDITFNFDHSKFEVISVMPTGVLDTTSLNAPPLSHSYDNANGTVTFSWEEPTTQGEILPHASTHVLAKIKFRLKNFPNNTQPSYHSDLTWDINGSQVYYCLTGNNFVEIDDALLNWSDGSIDVTRLYNDITYTVDPTPVACPDDRATVTITSPVAAGNQYTFNGGTNWSTNNVAQSLPGTNRLQVKDAEGCLSVVELVTVEGPEPVTFNYVIEPERCNNQGAITFLPQGGSGEYGYVVMTQDQINSFSWQFWTYQEFIDAGVVQFTPNFTGPEGRYYIFAFNKDCEFTAGQFSNYAERVYIDSEATFELIVTPTDIACSGAADGEISVWIPSGTVSGTVYASLDGGTPVEVVPYTSINTTFSGVAAGTYSLVVYDNVCNTYTEVTVSEASPVEFLVEYRDAECALDPNGELWINSITIDGTTYTDLTSLSSDWEFIVSGYGTQAETTYSLTTSAMDLAPNNYYVWLYNASTGCRVAYKNNNNLDQNIVPVFSNGVINFDAYVSNDACENGQAQIGVTDVHRSCPSCAVSPTYEFGYTTSTDPTTITDWIPVDETFTGVAVGNYNVFVKDVTASDVCSVAQEVEVGDIESLVVTISEIHPPTCKGGNDGWVRMFVDGGQAPYSYSVDNAPNWRPHPTFGLTEGEHLLQVRDAIGCIWSETIMVDILDPIVLEASASTLTCYDERTAISVTFSSTTNFTSTSSYNFFYTDVAGDNPINDGLTLIPTENQTANLPATKLVAGTYWIQAKDAYGCVSNIYKLVIQGVDELNVDPPVVEDAQCYGTWSGRVTLVAHDGNIVSSTYEYAFANNPDYFANAPASSIQWYPFVDTETSTTIELQKGEYWFVVRDNCDQTAPVQVIIDGYDEIKINNVPGQFATCNGEANATLTIDESEITGGAPGYGVPGSHYLYTLLDDNGDVVGTAQQTSTVFENLAAGTYTLVVYDSTNPTASPAQCPPAYKTIEVVEPNPLALDTELAHVSCFNEQDGEIRVTITGGVGGTYGVPGQTVSPSTDNNSYKVTINGITRPSQNFSLELADDENYVEFQVMSGEFFIQVEDAFGCIATETVTVMQPEEWDIDYTLNPPTDCDTEDGTLSLTITGGFKDAVIEYSTDSVTWMVADITTNATTWTATGAITSVTYGNEYHIYVRNTDVPYGLANDQCLADTVISVEPFNPYHFEVDTECTLCHGEENGKVTISNITGGNATGYQIQLTGPFAPGTTVSQVSMAYEPNNEDRWWPKDEAGSNVYITETTIDTLAAGVYYVYLRDNNDYTLARCCRPVEFTICETDSLELVVVELLKNVDCKGDSTGSIKITAEGGTPPYQFNYTYTNILDDNYEYQARDSIKPELWQTDSVFTGLPAGAYIGWVKDANGCISGCEINGQGLPIDEHRAVVSEAGDIDITSYEITSPECYGGEAQIEFYVQDDATATGTYTFMIEGNTYEGDAFSHTYAPMPKGELSYVLDGFVAPDSLGYTVKLVTDLECESSGQVFTMTQPEVFKVEANIATGALCPGDNDVLVTISTIGGTAPFTYDIYKDGVLDRENSTIVNHVMYVGSTYTVVATDAEGCEQDVRLEIPTPVAVDFVVKDVSCYGDDNASAWITVTESTVGRTHEVRFAQRLQNGNGPWSDWIEFDQEIIIDTLSYGDGNEYDGHYDFQVRDNNYCPAHSEFLTFVPVQNRLRIISTDVESDMLTVEAVGGMVDQNLNNHYMYAVVKTDEVGVATKTWQTDPVFTDLDYAEYTVFVKDFNLCEATATVTAGITAYTLAEINGTNDESPVVGEAAKSTGTITGIVDGEGFFMQDANVARSGIWVSTDMTSDLVIGDGAMVYGTVAEVNSITTIIADNVVSSTAPITVEPMEIATPTEVKDEDYESMLVMVSGVRANEANSEGMWKVYYEMTDSVIVNDWMHAYSPVADNYYDVTGVVNGMNNAYYIEPRMDEDIVNLTATPNKPEVDEVSYKVYPNPFDNNIYIDNASKLSRVVISNIVGQRVIDITNPVREIRTQNLVSGVYVVSLYTESGLVKTERIIKR